MNSGVTRRFVQRLARCCGDLGFPLSAALVLARCSRLGWLARWNREQVLPLRVDGIGCDVCPRLAGLDEADGVQRDAEGWADVFIACARVQESFDLRDLLFGQLDVQVARTA
ncbi:MAG TPA: hypothetical protein VGS19_30305 [Streptosporangiaceae bacterium]|nr:hypothetical protein [Streptosporangiaceae bacterium]